MATSFTINFPSSVGTHWIFAVNVVGSDVVIVGSLAAVPTFYLMGF